MAQALEPILGQRGLVELLNFEYDAVNYIYNLPPQQNNLFWAGNFTAIRSNPGDSPNDKDVKTKDGAFFTNAQFRIQGINFDMPRIDYEENKVLRVEFIKGVTIPHEVTIKWLEDAYHSVRQYHLNWLNSWYDRTKDCLVCGTEGKLRHCDLLLFHYVNAVEQSDYTNSGAPLEVPIPEVVAAFRLNGLMPKSFAPIKADYSEDGNGEVISYSYSVLSTDVQYFYDDNTKFWKPDKENEINRLKETFIDNMKNGGVTMRKLT